MNRKGKGADKWVTRIGPDETVANSARLTLKPRIEAVISFLELAVSHWQDDPEYVHQLRVQTRRSLAAIEMYRPVLPRHERKQLQGFLARVRKVSGEARDLDVLRQRYARTNDPDESISECREGIHLQFDEHRRKAQDPIKRLHQKLVVSGRLKRCRKGLLQSVSKSKRSSRTTFDPWARDRFRKSVKQFVASIPKPGASWKTWHRFRIRCKQFRYTMELVSPLYDHSFRTGLYLCVSDVQDQLGKLVDHASVARQLATLADGNESTEAKMLIEKMVQGEQQQFAMALLEFQRWWLNHAESELMPQLGAYDR